MFDDHQVWIKSIWIDFQEFYLKNLTFVPVVILNSLHFLLKLYQLEREEDVLFERDQAVDLADLLEYCLIVVSFGNAAYLFMYCRKRYTLLQHPTQEEYPSSEYDSGIGCFNLKGWDLELKTKNARLELLKSDRLVWVLNTWDPHPGKLSIFTFFSPAQVLQISLCNSQNCGLLMLSGYLTAFMLYFTISAFEERSIDQRIIAGELVKESKGAGTEIVYTKLLK